jgi:hypothetical protein
MPKAKQRTTPLTSSHMDDPPWTKKELSDWCNCTKRFLELEVAAGRLRAVKLGTRAVRFLPRDIERWINSQATTPVAAETATAET